MIPIKSDCQISSMRAACRIAADVLHKLCSVVAPGVNTYDIDQEARHLIALAGAKSACYGYKNGNLPFPSHTCLSVNDEVVHGIGRLSRVLKPGDIITVDVCVEYKGYIGDNARTVAVGPVSQDIQQLLTVTEAALFQGISQAIAGNRVGAISYAIERAVKPHRYGIIRDFVGHGVGRSMHEAPQIPNFGPRNRGEVLRPGMTVAIEPMVCLGRPSVRIGSDGWTAYTNDGSPAAHFEHTILVTQSNPEILTVTTEENLHGCME